MQQYRVTIEGIVPILFNRFTEEAQGKVDRRETGGILTQEEKIAEAMDKVYRDDAGHLCVPAENIKKAIVEGAQRMNLKFGNKAAASFIRAVCFIKPWYVPFVPERTEPDRIHEKGGRRPPRRGGRVIIRRPLIEQGWRLAFTIYKLDDAFPSEIVKAAIEGAGIHKGLCDWRPEFGRFIVTEWREIEE